MVDLAEFKRYLTAENPYALNILDNILVAEISLCKDLDYQILVEDILDKIRDIRSE